MSLSVKNTLGGGKPEGMYVWKKYKYNPPVTVSNPSITITCPSTYGNKLNITSADIDIKTLWKDLRDTGAGKDLSKILTDADGNISEWKSSSGISIGLASSMTSKIGFVSNSGTQGISYLQEDTSLSTYCAFNMGSSTNYSSYAGTYTFNGEYKISDSSAEFLDYIVSDKETAYPDGGEKGGYWYEKVASNIASGSITPTSNVTSLSIEHNLGANPKILFVFANVLISTDNANKIQTVAITDTETLVAYGSYSGGATSNNATIVNDSTNQLTLSAKDSAGSTSLSFNKNTSYKWIAIG